MSARGGILRRAADCAACYISAVEERPDDEVPYRLGWLRLMVDRAIVRLETERPESPLLKLERPELRRILAVAAYREIRTLRREIDAG